MDSQARVRAALSLERPDRPPAAWWGHTYREEWSPHDLASVTVARQREYGWDFVKLQPRACSFAQAFGAEYRPSDDFRTAPVPVSPAVRDPADWSRLPSADATAPPLRDQVEAVRTIVEELGPSVPVIQTVFSPLTVAGYLLAEDKHRAAGQLREHPEAVGAALERVSVGLADFAARSVEAGAAGIFYAISGYASADLLSMEEYERLALPHDLRVLDGVPGGAWFNVLHLCGPRIHFELASALRSHALSWSVHEPGNPSLAEGRDRTGRAAMGGIDQARTLVEGTPEDVLKEVRAAISSTGGRGLLLAPGCSVPPGAPEENLRALTRRSRRRPDSEHRAPRNRVRPP
ncbi:MAG: uroporphyrinogen decarboxylase family protein [Actinomycetota bacterium]